MPEAPRDALARPLHDLRISVTDRCNFRCPFCMPKEGSYDFIPRRKLLTYEEITRLAGLFSQLGVRKIRLTGGEPLLRSDLHLLIRMLRDLDVFSDLALTTNGWLLGQRAAELRDAGLDRVTVSLHSLDPERFATMNGLDFDLDRVLGSIAAAGRAGLSPVKVNSVIVRDNNEDEILDLARFGRDRGVVVRFIEYMDVGTLNSWDPAAVVTAREIVERIDAVHPLEALEPARPGEVARRFRYRDGGGEIGVIASVSQPFCGACDRARLSARGELFLCLFASVGHDLRKPLREEASDDEMLDLLRGIWEGRTDRYSEERAGKLSKGNYRPGPKVEMFRMGG